MHPRSAKYVRSEMEVSGPNARVVVGGAVCAECDGFGGDGMVGDVGVDDDITRHGGTVSLGATSIVDSNIRVRTGVRKRTPVSRRLRHGRTLRPTPRRRARRSGKTSRQAGWRKFKGRTGVNATGTQGQVVVAAARGVGVRQGGRGPVGRSSEQTVETSGCASVAVDVAAAAGTAGEQSG